MEFIENRLEWGTGQSYQDRNIKIIFNTFLKENDYRVDNDVLQSLITKGGIAQPLAWAHNTYISSKNLACS